MSAIAIDVTAPTQVPQKESNDLPAGWLHDPLEALNRERGPFTAVTAEEILDQEAVELYNGWLVPQEMTDPLERRNLGTIQDAMSISARKAGFGQILPDQVECLLNNGTVIKPDACLISWARFDQDVVPYGPRNRPTLMGCPELVIESRSPSNRRRQEAAKRARYFANGAQIVWDVDEPNEVIYVYRAEEPETPVRFAGADLIDCEPLLPKWQRRVVDLFAPYASAEVVVGEVAEEWREEGVEIGREEGIEIGREEGIEIGREEGASQRSVEIARAMINDGLDVATIAKYSGLTPEQVAVLQSQ